MKHAREAALALTAILGLAACERSYLTWTPREPLSARRGRVSVAVEDHRAGDKRALGRAFGWGGVPRDILVDGDHVRARIERLAKEATVTAGLGLPAPAEEPTSRLHLDIDALSCDGLDLTARATLSVRFSITTPEDEPRLPTQVIDARGKGHGCQDALGVALDVLLDELAARLVEGPAHDAALGTTLGA